MTSEKLIIELHNVIQKVEHILNNISSKYNENSENDHVIKIYEEALNILNHLENGIYQRETGLNLLKLLKIQTQKEGIINIFNKSFQVQHLPHLFIGLILSNIWGIYDNLSYICLLLRKSWETEDDRKININFISLPKQIFIDKYSSVPNQTIGQLRKRYGYPIVLFYEIRNSILHRFGKLSEFIDNQPIADENISYKFSYNDVYKDLIDYCKQNWIQAKPEQWEQVLFGTIPENSEKCLLELIENLIVYTDNCIIEYINHIIDSLQKTWE